MKSFIKELLRENLFSERITMDNTNDLCVVFIRDENIFLLINGISKQPIGYIGFGPTNGDVYGIYGAYSEKGYGPLLYELVMTYVYPKGITMSDDSSTSQDAMNVWEKFASRNDVKKKPIIRTKQTDKEEWFNMMYGENPEQDRWIDRGRELHKTQFIYNLGKDKLGALIECGDEFVKKNPKINFMDLVYSLEK